MKVTATAIAERNEDMGEEAAQELIKACETAITAGNKDFLGVYQNVFNVILSGDADGMAKYDEAKYDGQEARRRRATRRGGRRGRALCRCGAHEAVVR